jgi:hypothetical protein
VLLSDLLLPDLVLLFGASVDVQVALERLVQILKIDDFAFDQIDLIPL